MGKKVQSRFTDPQASAHWNKVVKWCIDNCYGWQRAHGAESFRHRLIWVIEGHGAESSRHSTTDSCNGWNWFYFPLTRYRITKPTSGTLGWIKGEIWPSTRIHSSLLSDCRHNGVRCLTPMSPCLPLPSGTVALKLWAKIDPSKKEKKSHDHLPITNFTSQPRWFDVLSIPHYQKKFLNKFILNFLIKT